MNTKKINPHLPFIIALVILPLFFYSGLFEPPNLISKKCLPVGDARNDFLPGNFNIKESYFKYYQVPLWTHHRMSGTPFMAVGTKPVFYPPFLLFLILFDFGGATNLIMLFNFILGGIAMYALVYYLFKNRYASLISALIFTFCGYTSLWSFNVVEGWGIPYIPLIVLFTLKAASTKKWILYSVLTALCLALIFHSGGTVTFIYAGLLFGYVLLFKLFGAGFKKRLTKIFLIGFIVSLLIFGLIAVKLIPTVEFFKITNRNTPYTYERSLGGVYESPVQAFKFLFKGGTSDDEKAAYLGIVAFLLIILSLAKINNKKVLFFVVISLITILMVSPVPLYYILWKFVPFFNKQKNVGRMLIIFALAGSVLAGYGSIVLFNFV